ncbi:SGNH/GDSL hydrolase family protein [Streptomyces sp. ISL-96]|uniref:SGNH/GDSL hydrolase family protein n=1 Tax=Streptomyces sp. ISL-96 TaxID=2819191 RepID=UPI001BEB8459|nr:SGNH/GDSL hydrolase family protein [Streptomyces sp. ISL-96]MBT2489707.1 SGNH/GDSL hydrolase family protein [Streptomyces sp. ISL-96]
MVLAALALAWVTGCSDPSDASIAAAPPPAGPGAPTAARPVESASVPPTGAPAQSQPPREKSRVLYLGDSLAMETQRVLADRISAAGRATVHSAPYSGTTLCDYLADTARDSLVPPQDKAAALVRSQRPKVVVLQFWGNSWAYTPCMDSIPQGGGSRYYTRYAADAKALTEQIAAAARDVGIPRPRIVWVLQGPDAFSPDRVRRVNGIYRAQAAAGRDLVADAGLSVSPAGARYTWAQRLPCNDDERARSQDCRGGLTAVHRDDDHLHFCLAPTTKTPRPCPVHSPGIVRYCEAIATVVDAGLRPRA